MKGLNAAQKAMHAAVQKPGSIAVIVETIEGAPQEPGRYVSVSSFTLVRKFASSVTVRDQGGLLTFEALLTGPMTDLGYTHYLKVGAEWHMLRPIVPAEAK